MSRLLNFTGLTLSVFMLARASALLPALVIGLLCAFVYMTRGGE